MDPQNDQDQKKQSEGITSKGIDAFNNLSFLRNLSGKAGSKAVTQAAGKVVAQTAIKAAATTPVGWITIGVIVGIFIIVFIMMFVLGAPPTNNNLQAPAQTQSTQLPPAEL